MTYSRRGLLGRIAAGSTLLAVGSAVPARGAVPTEWPQFKFDAGNTGHAPDRSVPAAVETKWRYSTNRAIESAPAIVDGRCFVGANDGDLHAIDAASGDTLWRSAVGGEVGSPPAVANETVIVGGRTEIYGFDATSGEEQWTISTKASSVQTAPTVAGRSVYVSKGDESKAIEAIFHASGDHRVTFETPLGPTTPAVTDGSVIAGFDDGSVRSYDTRITNEEWAAVTETPVTVDPVVASLGDHAQPSVVSGDRDGVLRVSNAATGRLRWKYDLGAVAGSPAVGGNRIVVPAGGLSLQAFNANGSPAWSRELDGRITASPVLAESAVLIGGGSTMYALEADTGATRWSVALDGRITRAAAIAGGYVFVGTDAGHCYALGASDAEFGADWTATPTATATTTPSPTPTETDTPTPSETPTPTARPTDTRTPSPTPDETDGSLLGGLLEGVQSFLERLLG